MKYSDHFEREPDTKKHGNTGFYIALAICLLAVGGVAVGTFVGNISADDKKEATTAPITVARITTAQPVAVKITDVTDTRTTVTTTTTTAPKTSTDQAGIFVFPASNTVLMRYSETPVYSRTLDSWSSHSGVDFRTTDAQKIKATADGTVLKIYDDPLWGKTVEIDHGNKILSRYCGVTPQALTVGTKVKAGDTIGISSSVPAEVVDGSHLHLEIESNGKPIDPLTLIRGTVVFEKVKTTSATEDAVAKTAVSKTEKK